MYQGLTLRLLRLGKVIDRSRGYQGLGGQGMGDYHLMGIEFPFGMMKKL